MTAMRPSVRTIVTVALAAALAGLAGLAAGCSSSGSHQLSGLVRSPKLDVASVQLPDVSTQPASTFAMKAKPGGFLLVYFGYTMCPDLCPMTLATLRAARSDLGSAASRVEIAFVTLDPARDTPAVLRSYVSRYMADAHLLRSASSTKLAAAKHSFLVSASMAANGTITHSASVAVVDSRGVVQVEWPFGLSAKTIARDLRTLLDRETA